MAPIGSREALDSRNRRGRRQLGLQLGAGCLARGRPADLAGQIIGLEGVFAHPDRAGPGQPLAPGGDVSPVLRVLAGKDLGQGILGELDRGRIVAAVTAAACRTAIASVVEVVLAVAGAVEFPDLFGFRPEPGLLPRRVDAGVVVVDDLLPGLGGGDVALAAAPDPVADDPRQGIKAGCSVDTAFAHGPAKQLGHGSRARAGVVVVKL
jgi:hypothetical protein